MSPISIRTARMLRELATDTPLELPVRGDCMAPLLASGTMILVARRRFYWPGDLLVVHSTDGRLLVHRLLGGYPKKGGMRLLTQADTASRPDAALPPARVVGKVMGGRIHTRAIHVPLSHRLWACGRFLLHLLQAVYRRL